MTKPLKKAPKKPRFVEDYSGESLKKLIERRAFFNKQAMIRRAVEAERQSHADKSLYVANLVNAGYTPAMAQLAARNHFA
jgi:predicted Ser/Thr protein kinase